MTIERALSAALPEVEVSATSVDRTFYARDLWPRHHLAVRDGAIAEHPPAAVVWPQTTAELARIVELCAREGTPIAPFGAGSGVCGGTLPDRRTLVVDLKKLQRIVALEGDVLDVEAGAMGIRLEEDLEARGKTLGHFPSSILCSTVGGWVAARSAGQCSGRYGKIEDMVVDLELVTGTGQVVELRRRLAGPDLTPLVIGSEGIFGIVTRARLRVHAAPAQRALGAISFPTVEHGTEAMREIFQAGLRPAVSRLYDAFDSYMAKRGRVKHETPDVGAHRASAKARRSAGLGTDLKRALLRTVLDRPSILNSVVERAGDRLFGGTMLVLIFEGAGSECHEDLGRALRIAERHAGKSLGPAPAEHWLAHRYSVSYRQAPVFMAGAFSDTMEVAAPWARLAELYAGVKKAMSRHVFVMAHFSHAYPDGCSIYFTFAGSAPNRELAEAKYDAAWSDAMDAVLEAGATLSHHHGVGRSKAPKLGVEMGAGVEVCRNLKTALDPHGIMNPGNLLPAGAVRRPRRIEPPAAPLFDELSLLAHVPGSATLGAVEESAQARGLSLRIDWETQSGAGGFDRRETVASFLARGAPGALDAWEDPVDHLVAGFSARLRSGEDVTVHSGPRRAVGPDLYALFHGAQGAAGDVQSAYLRVHRNGLSSRRLPASIERNPSFAPGERELADQLLAAAAQSRCVD